MTVKSYRAPWGRKIWLITGSTSLLGIGAAIAMPLLIQARNPKDAWALWLVSIVILIIIGSTSLWSIRRFEITDDALRVCRVFWSNRIAMTSIQSVEVDPQACQRAWKTIGNDGLFALHGRFRSKRLGKFQAYVTDPANCVVLKVPGDTIVISPENPAGFVKELNRRIERLKEKL